jgi:hypothetical protein
MSDALASNLNSARLEAYAHPLPPAAQPHLKPGFFISTNRNME